MAVEQEVTVKHAAGLHARPAALFVSAAKGFTARIEVGARGIWVDAKSIMGVLRLGVRQGETVVLRADGEDAAAAVAALTAVLDGDGA